jgi:heptosyltransferase-2
VERSLVIRFGALGDLCLCGWFLAGVADAGGPPATLVTKARFAPLAARFAGVDEVVALAGGGWGDLARLAHRLRGRRADVWLDAHAVLRSRALTMMLGRAADARLRKDTLHRLALIGSRRTPWPEPADAAPCSLLDRFCALSPALGLPADVVRAAARPPLQGVFASGAAPRLALAPGARWATKRWPEAHAAALVDRLAVERPLALSVLLGPDEAAWFDGGPLAAAVARHPDARVLRGRPLPEIAAELAGCRVAVVNDSGLLHLSEAVGTPVVATFGPTVRAFGYAPLLRSSILLERDLDCRPCSRTGSRPCHRGDLACLQEISPTTVFTAVRALLEHGAAS